MNIHHKYLCELVGSLNWGMMMMMKKKEGGGGGRGGGGE